MVGRIRSVREFVDPVIRSLYPIPGIAWIPLAILWFGLGNTAVIFVVVIAEFFPLYFNTEAGARNINPVLIDAALCFGAKRLTLFRRVILPASIPYIITGMRIALGGAWRMIVAVPKMLASETGIGYMLMEARFQFRAVDLMTAMILISIVGYATERSHHRYSREENHRKVGSEGLLGNDTMHAISKIIARHAGRDSVEVGEIVNVMPDYVMLNDRGAARAADLLRKMGGDKVFDPAKCIVVFDHHYPPIRQQDSVSQKRTREWIKEQGIAKFHAGEGIGHVIFPEKGYAFPGALIFGTDSHTVTNSALGCVATGMGHSDITSFLALGYNWLKVPEVIRFNLLHGEFRPGVYMPRTSRCGLRSSTAKTPRPTSALSSPVRWLRGCQCPSASCCAIW